ncbi:MAG TPA: DNA polymerase III subunit beta [Candidatus Anoxymicrobiaceae bacterium]|jgi:DNA polymerase-3 subunit beta
MIVSCEKDKLNNLVQTALRGVSSRVTMPILSGLLITAEGGRITISSTDLEMSIKAELEADISESGSTVVSGRLLGDIVKSLPAGQLQIETGEKFLTVKSTGGEFRIREMMPEDFPQIPAWEGATVVKVTGGEFMVAVQQTARASSTDEKRPVLTGTLVEKNVADSTLKLVATDSYRLAWKEAEVSGSVADWEDCIIPSKTMNEVARLAGGSDADVELKMQDKQVMFKIGDLSISSRLIEGQFPNYKQLIPKGEKTSVKIEKDVLSAAVKRALIFGHNMRVGIYSDHLRVTTETPEVGDSKEEIPADINGEEMEIGFNGTYLMDGLSGVESEKVEIKLDDPQKPALVRTDESDKYNYILMPVRLR